MVGQLAREYAGKVDIYGMDTDANPDTPSTLGIMSIPTIVFYKGGQEVTRIVGGNRAKIDEVLKKLVA